MTLMGLHIFDIIVIVFYLALMLYIGKLVSKNIKGQADFFLAGRKLGKVIQFFLNFGQMTDANGAATTSAFVFRSGIAGVWFGLQTLFMTPYYWFMNAWFRRVRLTTMAELFEDRFGGRELTTIYAVTGILGATLAVGSGYLISARVMEAMMIKPVVEYTQADIEMLEKFAEYSELSKQYETGTLPDEKRQRYQTLWSFKEKGQILPYVTYLNENWFYIVYSLIIGSYIVLGGFEAAAITDAIQGILIIVFSLILIPFGLMRIGGFSGLHEQLPETMAAMFGNVTSGEFTWFSVLAILLVSWITIHGVPGNMSIAGSAKDEMSARFGAVTGGFCKRFMTIAWGFCGLIAYVLFKDTITNPDTTWGVLTKGLLCPGAVGLMLSGILAANMSTLDAMAIQISALFVLHIYKPMFPNRKEKEYIFAGRVTIVIILIVGILVAKYTQSVLSLMKFMLGTGVTFGAPIILMFFWRRLTKQAVIIQVVTCLIMLFLLPMLLPLVDFVGKNQDLMVRTNPRVCNGIVVIKPVSIFFDAVIQSNLHDPSSPLMGSGSFRLELFLLSKLGFDFTEYSPAALLATRYVYNSVFPFILLFIVSFLTNPTDERTLKRFYGKMSTPVIADPLLDEKEVELTIVNPHRFDNSKLFPNSQWEFKKWDKTDFIGFVLCCVMVGVVLGVFWLVLNIGKP